MDFHVFRYFAVYVVNVGGLSLLKASQNDILFKMLKWWNFYTVNDQQIWSNRCPLSNKHLLCNKIPILLSLIDAPL